MNIRSMMLHSAGLSLVMIICLMPASAQILKFLPVTDTIIIGNLSDLGAALQYSVDTSVVSIDSIKITSAIGMRIPSSGRLLAIPYCTFVVRDSSRQNKYEVWMIRDTPSLPLRILIRQGQYTPIFAGSGFLSLVVSRADQPIDSLRVRCIIPSPDAVTRQADDSSPSRLLMFANYPNPFNGQTTIRYFLPTSASVNLSLYTVTGQLARRVFESAQPSGFHTLYLNVGDLPSGVYFAMLSDHLHAIVIPVALIR